MHVKRSYQVILLLALLAWVGCGGGDTDSSKTQLPVRPVQHALKRSAAPRVTPTSLKSASGSAKTTSAASSAQTASAKAPVQTSATSGESSAAANSTPQFNLFAPPRVDLPIIKQSAQREKNEPIRLIGFVNVKSPKALLAFDGRIRGMEVGETYNNVEVIDINPPQVTLQRGKDRWITTLFDQPVVNQQASTRSASAHSGPRVTIGQRQEQATRPHAGQWPDWSGSGVPAPGMQPFGSNASAGTTQAAPLFPFPTFPGRHLGNTDPLPLPPLPQLPGVQPTSK